MLDGARRAASRDTTERATRLEAAATPAPSLDPRRGRMRKRAPPSAINPVLPCTSPRIDVLSLGNAIVDVLAHTDEAFLVAKNVHKGAMQLIDEARAERALRRHGPGDDHLGRLGRQHRRGVASLGGQGGLHRQGEGRRDSAASSPTISRRSASTSTCRRAEDGPATARSFILVTPDGERTMNTYLGACQNLTPDDVDRDTVEAASRTSISKAICGIRRPGQGGLPQGRDDRPRGRQQGRADAVGRLLRRSLPRRVPRPDARRQPRHPVRQHPRAAEPLPDRPTRDTALAALREEKVLVARRDALGGGRPRRHPRGDARRAGLSGRAPRRHDGRRRPLRRRASWPACPATSTSPVAPASARLAAAEVIQHIGARPQTKPRRACPAGRALAVVPALAAVVLFHDYFGTRPAARG